MAQSPFQKSGIDLAIEEYGIGGAPAPEAIIAQTEQASTPARAEPKGPSKQLGVPFQSEFEAAARKYRVPVNVLMGMAEQESGFNPNAKNPNSSATGIMQYIKGTAAERGINPLDPQQSIEAAAADISRRMRKGMTAEQAVAAHYGGDGGYTTSAAQAYAKQVLGRAKKFYGLYSGQPVEQSPEPAAIPGPVERLESQAPAEAPITAALPPEPRSWGEAAKDTGIAIGQGLVGVGMAGAWLGNKVGIGDGQTAADAYKLMQDMEKSKSAQAQAANQAVQKADGIAATISALIDNPTAIIDQVAQSAPLAIPGAGLGVGAAKTAAGIAARRGLGAAAEKAAAASAAVAAGRTAEALTSAGMGGAQAQQKVLATPLDKLQQVSTRFRELSQNMTPLQAREQLAREVGDASAALQGGATLVGSIVAGRANRALGLGDTFAGPITGKMAAGQVAKNVGGEVVEEVTQSPLEQVGQNVAGMKADDTKRNIEGALEDVGKSAVLGAVGAVGQSGVTQAAGAAAGLGRQAFSSEAAPAAAKAPAATQKPQDQAVAQPAQTEQAAQPQEASAGSRVIVEDATGAKVAGNIVESIKTKEGFAVRIVDDNGDERIINQESPVKIKAEQPGQRVPELDALFGATPDNTTPEAADVAAKADRPVVEAAAPAADREQAASSQAGELAADAGDAVAGRPEPGVGAAPVRAGESADTNPALSKDLAGAKPTNQEPVKSAEPAAAPVAADQPAASAAPIKKDSAKKLADMDYEELQGRMAFIEQQAKVSGYTAALTKARAATQAEMDARGKISKEIKARKAAADKAAVASGLTSDEISAIEQSAMDDSPKGMDQFLTTAAERLEQEAQKRKPQPAAPAAEQAPTAAEPVKWFGSKPKADQWIAKQSNPADFTVEKGAGGRWEIRKAAQPAAEASNATKAEQPEAKESKVGKTLFDANGTMYRVESESADQIKLTRSPDMLSEKKVVMSGADFQRLLDDDKTYRTESEAAAKAAMKKAAEINAVVLEPSRPKTKAMQWVESSADQRREMLRAAGYTDADQARAYSGMEWADLPSRVRDAMDAAAAPAKAASVIDNRETNPGEYIVKGGDGRSNLARFEIGRNGQPVRTKYFFEAQGTRNEADAAIKAFMEARKADIDNLFGEPEAEKSLVKDGRNEQKAAEPNPFAGNKLFTADKVEAARARLKQKLSGSQLNSGIDPELLVDGMTIAGAYIESGVRNFSQYAARMTGDFGDTIKPYLLSFWEGARNYPGLDTKGMTSPEESAQLHAALMGEKHEPEVAAKHAEVVGTQPKATRTKKASGTAGDKRMRQDWGVDHIDGYAETDEFSGEQTDFGVQGGVKSAFLKDAQSYLKAVATILEASGFEATGKKAVNINEAGPAVSGDVYLGMKSGNAFIKVQIGETAIRGIAPTTNAGVAVMFRAGKGKDTAGTNRWAPTDLSARDLADMIMNEARPLIGQEQTNDTQGTEADAGAGAARQQSGRVSSAVAEPSAAQEVSGDAGSRVRGQRERGDAGAAEQVRQPRQPREGAGDEQRDGRDSKAGAGSSNGSNYRIQPGELTRTGSWKATAQRNVEIVELVQKLIAEGRPATADEKALLTKFTGWGASEIANGIFPNQYGRYKEGWQELGERLKAALSPEEYAEARRTTQYAHYTSEPIIRSVYGALERIGFNGGQVLEPGMGVGLFAGLMPDSMAAATQYTGIEYDTITGNIAKLLYPESNIIVGDFTQTKLPRDFFDAAIGNPPFGQIKIQTDSEYKKQGFLLHDYFFAKTIDRVKPGGVLVFVTSKGTMNKASDRARSYLAERANLLGAIRLPQTAFKDNAGTEVVTDVIFLQKRGPGIEDNGVKWQGLAQVQTPQGPAMVNEYFAANPDMVLGRHALTGSMYRKDEYTVEPIEGDIEALFAKAIEKLPQGVYRPERGSRAEAAAVRQRDYDPKVKKEGGIYVADDGTLMQVESGSGVPLTERLGSNGKMLALKPKEIEWLKGYASLRDALKQAQYDQLNDGPWEASLAALQKAYADFTKKHGEILSHSVSERENDDGSVTVIRRFKNEPLIRMDAEGALAYALEVINQDGTVSPGAVLKGRILNKPKQAEITNTNDALFVSLNELGRLDMGRIAQLAGKSEQDVISELGTLVYEDPSSGWKMADEYLSGNVVRKLKEAESAARINKKYARNVEALKNVQPRALAPTDITVQLGSAWVPASDIANFAAEKLGTSASVSYNRVTGQWQVTGGNDRVNEFGTTDYPVSTLLQDVLNNRSVKVTRKDSEGKTYTDAEATELANQKARDMRVAFKEWIWSDARRADRLARFYNEHYNNIVAPTYDGSHLTLPGVSTRFKLYPHQKRAIWRTIQQGDTYLAHAVGAGKTFTMIASAMEERRLGLIKKPMMVVPNHMLAQFSKEFLELYPTASIMVADETNFHTHNRRKFVAQAALNDPDAIVITHSAFSRIGMSPDFVEKFLTKQISEWEMALAEADKGDRVTIKQIERRIEQLQNRLAATISDKKDLSLTFEQLGVDRLYVDEMHEFRKLDFATNRANVKGIDPSGSQRSMDLMMKVQYLREGSPDRAIVGASGTPITNTMGELFTVQRIFSPAQLEEDGNESFDSWSNQFGEVVDGLEQNAAGGYETVSRFAKFVNVPELMSRVRSFMDILTSSNLGELVQRPTVNDGGRQVVVTPVPDGYKAYQKQLEQRIKDIRKRRGPPEPGDDIILSVISDGRFSAIDMRFVDPSLPSDPNSKLNRTIDAMIEAYRAGANNEYRTGDVIDPIKGSSIMLFTDIGLGEQSAKSRGFDMKSWIEKRLIEGGVEPGHIAFMRDHKAHAKKERLFDDLRQGRKRILIGGKDMETGVNAQKRLTDLFHLDAPWFPASVEQREGRIIRQGNQNKRVNIKAFATKGSYDSTMWGMNARKARFIEAAMNGDSSTRSLEDVSEASAFEMAAALASGDERYMKLAGLKGDVDRLDRLYGAHMTEQRRFRSEKMGAEQSIAHSSKVADELRAAIAKREPIQSGEFSATLEGKTYDSREEYSQAAADAFKDLAEQNIVDQRKLGKLGGFDLIYTGVEIGRTGNFAAELSLDLPDSPDALLTFPTDPNTSISGIATRAVNQVMRLDRQLAERQEEIARQQRRKEQLESRIGAPFAQEGELNEKREALAELEAELAKESAEAASAEAAAATVEVEGKPEEPKLRQPDRGASPSIGADEVERIMRDAGFGEQIDNGSLVIHKNESSLPIKVPVGTLGLSEGRGKRMHLNARALTREMVLPVALHEGFHSGAQRLIGTEQWDRLINRLTVIYKQQRASTGKAGEFWAGVRKIIEAGDREYQRVYGRPMSDQLKAEELGAYALDHFEIAPPTIAKLIEAILGEVKAWALRRFGKQLGEVTPAQLRALAKAALRSMNMSAELPVQNAALGMMALNERALRVIAYHGTPHKVDEFSTDYIGDDVKILDGDNPEAMLRQAEEAIDDDKPEIRYIGDVPMDIGPVSRFLLHPRQIASLYKEFVAPYRTALSQFEMRDQLIDEMREDYLPYSGLSNKQKANVNKVLELGRLMGSTFSPDQLAEGVVNKGFKQAYARTDRGQLVRSDKKFEAQLSGAGEVIQLSQQEIAAYQSLRNLFDNALDKFRDQSLKEYGFPELMGKKGAAKAILESVSDDMTAERKARVAQIANFIAEIENAKITGYVPFSRYGRFVVSVKKPRAEIEFVKNEQGGWTAVGVPESMAEFMAEIGSEYDEAEGGWHVDRTQRQALKRENEETLYSTKVEPTLADKAALKLGKPLDQLPSVKKAIAEAQAKYAGQGGYVDVFDTERAQPEEGVKLSDVDALAQIAMLDTATWDDVREKLADAIKGRSFRKHFFQSENVPGYSADFERSIADYMVGMSGYLSRRHHAPLWDDAVGSIKAKNLSRYAGKYRDYVNNPQEELSTIRLVGFFSYIAGVPMTALANLTQPLLMTLPKVAQLVGMGTATVQMGRAFKDALAMMSFGSLKDLTFFDPEKAPADIRAELKAAWEKGQFVPLETYDVMATARGASSTIRGARRFADKAVTNVAFLFSYAERLNRLVTFMMAARLAKTPGMEQKLKAALSRDALAASINRKFDAEQFADWLVEETQFKMGKVNRPEIMRGVGTVLLQFKGFMMQSLEAWYRWAKLHDGGAKAVAMSMAMMASIGGVWGLPGAEEVRSAVESSYKAITKQDLDIKTEMRLWVADHMVESGAADYIASLTGGSASGVAKKVAAGVGKGLSYPAGFDLSRIGMGNIVPDQASQLLGIPGDMFYGRPTRAIGKLNNGDTMGALAELMPNFAKNPIMAQSWKENGIRDSKGRMLIPASDVTRSMVATKSLGGTPTKLTDIRDASYAVRRREGSVNELKTDFADRFARADVMLMRAQQAGNDAKANEAMKELDRIADELQAYNEKASDDQQIKITHRMRKNRALREEMGLAATFGKEKKQVREKADKIRGVYTLGEDDE